MTALEQKPSPEISIYVRHPELQRVKPPKNYLMVLDGNRRWIEKKAQGAIDGNPRDIDTMRDGVTRLTKLVSAYSNETPDVADYFQQFRELEDNAARMPMKDIVHLLKSHDLLPVVGHLFGTETLEARLQSLRELEIDFVGAWGFSFDNFTRPEPEKQALMWLFDRETRAHAQEIHEANGRFMVIGNRDSIPSRLQDTIEEVEEQTHNNNGQTFYLLLGYSGEDQEVRADIRLLDNPPPSGTIYNADMRKKYLDGGGKIPPADIIYLPGRPPAHEGLTHTSDLGWLNGKGTQLYFTETLWPDTSDEILVRSIVAYDREPKNMGRRPAPASPPSPSRV